MMEWENAGLTVRRNEWGEYVFIHKGGGFVIDQWDAKSLAEEILSDDLEILRLRLKAQENLAEAASKAHAEARAEVVELRCADAKRQHPYP